MARTIAEIQQLMITDVGGNEVLSTRLYSTSKTARWRLTTYIVAVAIWMLEKLFDTHKSTTEETLLLMKPHSLLWISNKAKAFQYGHSLMSESDLYETEDTEAQIIKQATADEGEDAYIKLKVAKEGAEGLEELTGEWPNAGLSAPITETSGGSGEKLAFYTYMERVKDAGTYYRYVSREGDHLRLTVDIYYDPLVLNENGERLDGTNNTPVQDANTLYIESLPFNGEFSIMALTDEFQKVDGVVVPQVLSAESYWGTYDWVTINAIYKPEAGWLKVYDDDLTINWKAHGTNI